MVKGVAGLIFELVDPLGVVWRARSGVEVGFGRCLMAEERAKGLRIMNAIVAREWKEYGRRWMAWNHKQGLIATPR